MKALAPSLSVRPARAAASVPLGRWRAGVLIGFMVVYFALQIGSFTQQSTTYDEPVHLAAGYAALVNRDHRLDPTHPPFVRMWAALPLLGISDIHFPSEVIDTLPQERSLPLQNMIAHDFLYAGRAADRMLYSGRFMIVLLGVLLGLLIFKWTEAWLGFPTACLTLAFYILSPNLAAHASLVTTDFAVACFFFGAIYFLWRTARDFKPSNAAGCVIFFSLAIVTKFSAALLVPTGVILLALAKKHPGGLTWKRIFGLGILTALAAWLTIWAVYGFHYEPSAKAGWVFNTRLSQAIVREQPILSGVLNWIDAHRLLPNAFTQGFLICFSSSENPPGYFLGEISTRGWWYYFPVAILVKTPEVLLALLVGGSLILARRMRSREAVWNAACLLLPVAVYLGLAMTSSINLGLRHVLPVFPFFIVIAGVATREILVRVKQPRVKYGILACLLGFWAVSFSVAYPHTLTFFNVAAGGPKHGSDYLTDSNLDWGQHLKLLKKWMDRHDVSRINLAYFGVDDPTYRGIACVMLPGARDYLKGRVTKPEVPGYVAISQTIASGVYLGPEWREFYAGFKKLEPVAVLGNTLKVYRVEKWPEPDESGNEEDVMNRGLLAERLLSAGWMEYAAFYYRGYLGHSPEDIAIHAHLAQALADLGLRSEASRTLQRAYELASADINPKAQFAVRLIERKQFHSAIPAARTLMQLMPTRGIANDIYGLALAGDGQLTEACHQFEAALNIEPNNPSFREHLTRATEQRLKLTR